MIKIFSSDAITCTCMHDTALTIKQHIQVFSVSLLQNVFRVMAAIVSVFLHRIPCFNTHYATMRNFQRKEETIDQPWLWPHLTFD